VPVTASRGRTLETGLNRLARSPLVLPPTPEPNPPRIAGLLPPPPPILAPPADTSGPVPAGERSTPIVWSAEDINRVARQTPQSPPPVMPGFATEGVGRPQNPFLATQGRATLGQRINVLPTEHPGEGNYAGLLPGPPSPFEPPAPPPPVPQVGGPPTLGFPPTMPDPMWTPRMTPFSPSWDIPDPNQPVTTPTGAAYRRLLLARPLFPPAQ
jgi:hypothetical protein